MQHRNQNNPPSEFALFTNGKTASFATFYNIALKKIIRIINDFSNSKAPFIEKHIYTLNTDKTKIEIELLAYSKLKDYLWRGYTDVKNSSGNEFTENDKILINKLLIKLIGIRNFHSHIYHDNAPLQFDDDLKLFIEERFEIAKHSLFVNHPSSINKFLNDENIDIELFKYVANKKGYFLTQFGREFFLSFFISKQQMTRFINERFNENSRKIYKDPIAINLLRFYCINDKETRNKFSQEKKLFDELPPEHKLQILKLKQTYTIANYLKNLPAELMDTNKFNFVYPEFDKFGNNTNADEKINALDLLKIAQDCELFPNFTLKLEVIEKENKSIVNDINDSYQISVIHWKKYDSDIFVEMNLNDFRKCILLALNKTPIDYYLFGEKFSKTGKSIINDQINSYINERIEVIPLFISPPLDKTKILSDEEWNKKSFFWKGLSLDVKVYLEKVIRDYREGKNNKWKNNRKEAILKKLQSPIHLRFMDLFITLNQIQRKQNEFTKFVAQYIMDFQLLPELKWLHETFDTQEEEDELNSSQTKMVNKRILNYSSSRPLEKKYRLSLDNYQQLTVEYKGEIFILNPKSMRVIILAIIDGKVEAIKNLFPNLVEVFINNKKISDNHWASDTYRPAFRKKVEQNISFSDFKKQLDKKLNSRISEYSLILDQLKNNAYTHRRNEKNRKIMECYKLFEWKYNNGTEKFLRKDEYNKMSTYHYLLETNIHQGLIVDFKERIPKEIKTLLNSKSSINDLLYKVLNLTIKTLNQWKTELANCKVIDEEWKSRGSKLNVKWQKQTDYNKLPPYVINPMQILNFIYKEEGTKKFSLACKVLKEEKEGKIVFKQQFIKSLAEHNYDIDGYLAIMDNSILLTKKLIGWRNKILTEDAILMHLANDYLKKSASSFYAKHNIELEDLANIRNAKIIIPVNLGSNETVLLESSFHHVDDILFTETSEKLESIITYYINIYKLRSELERLKKQNNEEGTDLQLLIPYPQLINEYNLMLHHAMIYAKGLLDVERGIITELNLRKQIEEKALKKFGLRRIDFNQISELINTSFDIKELRNKSFHSDVPDNCTYIDYLSKPFVIRNLKIDENQVKRYYPNVEKEVVFGHKPFKFNV